MAEAAPQSYTVLVADDDPQILAMITARLQSHGYRVVGARDGAEALRLLKSSPPDAAVLDVMMPNMNGWDVAKAARAEASLSQVGIIMLTAIGERINEVTSPLHGADAYLDKPFSFDELERKIRAVIEQRSVATRPHP
jgi:DNA-binding response OmpR family regulator